MLIRLCLSQYCHQSLPLKPTKSLIAQGAHLKSLSTTSGRLKYEQYALYCQQHEHEITTIPLGLRDGYPDRIDFEGILDRLTGGWMKKDIGRLLGKPEGSEFWERALELRRDWKKGRLDVGGEISVG